MLARYYRFPMVAGITIDLHRADAVFSACVLKISGDQLEIVDTLPETNDLNALKTILPDRVPVAVNIIGRVVVIRKIKTAVTDQASLLKSVMPNAANEDFYIQALTSLDSTFVSVIRRAEADRWITAVSTLGFKVMQLSMGPFVLDQLLPQLNHYDGLLYLGGYGIRIADQGWLDCHVADESANPFPLKLNQESLDERLYLPYAAAFQLALAGELAPVEAIHPQLRQSLEEARAWNRFRIRGIGVLVILFALLLVNFVLFSRYHQENDQLSAEVGESVHNASLSGAVEDSVRKEKALIDSLGWEQHVDKSILIDQIAQLLPQGVGWEKVEIDPVLKAQDTQHPGFSKRLIRVTGSSPKIIPVNEWIERVKAKSWVGKVTLRDFSIDNETGMGQFVVEISY